MVGLQERGCHNINLVSPTHFVPQIVEALSLAVPNGLIIPLVYNTSGYEDTDTLRLLEGIIDIYMPDIKFGDNIIAKKYTKSSHYFDVAREAVKEMYRQVGDLQVDNQGITYRGLLVRHLVMPNNLASTDKVLKFIAEEISCDTLVNLMSQDYPAHKSYAFSELSRGITRYEYAQAVEQAQQFGLTRLITSSELNF
jgi:putative pyruvate formate lyase activating enzyme